MQYSNAYIIDLFSKFIVCLLERFLFKLNFIFERESKILYIIICTERNIIINIFILIILYNIII